MIWWYTCAPLGSGGKKKALCADFILLNEGVPLRCFLIWCEICPGRVRVCLQTRKMLKDKGK